MKKGEKVTLEKEEASNISAQIVEVNQGRVEIVEAENVTMNLPGLLVSTLLVLVVLLVPNGPVEQWRGVRARKSAHAAH